MRDYTWYDGAACINQDSSLFFATEKEVDKRRTALALCKGCSVRLACLQAAIDFDDEYIRGGTTHDQRRIMSLFITALTPIQSSSGGLSSNEQISLVQTVQVAIGISHNSIPEQSQFVPIPPFELDQSVLGVSGIQPLSTFLQIQAESESMPSPFDFTGCLVASTCS